MQAIKRKLRDIANLWSMVKGLKVTGGQFLQPQITVHYPRQEVDNLASFRGHLQLEPKPKNPAKPKCIACMMCVSVCPSGCITVVKKKPPKPTPEEEAQAKAAEEAGEKPAKKPAPKEPAHFIYDYSLCSQCGLCAENCPVKSLSFSDNIYLVARDRKQLKLDLLADLSARAGSEAGAGEA
jgi:NADH-quinone oxidoreductase subunit I